MSANTQSARFRPNPMNRETKRPAWLLPPDHPGAGDPSALVSVVKAGEVFEQAHARTVTSPTAQAAVTIQLFERDGNVNAIAEVLAAQVSAVNAGDMKHAEAMLISQASTLNELFNSLARRAHAQTGLHQFETHLRIALRAQAQCCRTLEVLAGIKNPPVIFAKQANVTTGPQQVNNGVPAPAQQLDFQQNKLSGSDYELHADTRAPAIAGRPNSTLETVGAINGAGDVQGQGEDKPQRIQGGRTASATADRASSPRAKKNR